LTEPPRDGDGQYSRTRASLRIRAFIRCHSVGGRRAGGLTTGNAVKAHWYCRQGTLRPLHDSNIPRPSTRRVLPAPLQAAMRRPLRSRPVKACARKPVVADARNNQLAVILQPHIKARLERKTSCADKKYGGYTECIAILQKTADDVQRTRLQTTRHDIEMQLGWRMPRPPEDCWLNSGVSLLESQ